MPAKTDLERLVVQMSADFRDYERGMRQAQRTTDRRMTAIEKRAGTMNKKVTAAFAGIAAGVSFAKLKGEIATIVAEASKIGKVSTEIGVTAEYLQELQYVSGLAGIAANDLSKGMEQFTKRLGEAAAKGGPLADIMKANNVSLRNAEGRIRPVNEMLEVFADLIANAGSESERLFIANEAFGRSGLRMTNVLNKGSGALREQLKAARELGVALDNDLIRVAEDLEDQWAAVTASMEKRWDETVLSILQGVRDSAVLVDIAENMDTVVAAAETLAIVLSGALVGKGLALLISSVGGAVGALRTLLGAMVAARTGAALTGAAFRTAFLSALGPIGAVVAILGVVSTAFGEVETSVSRATRKMAEQALPAEALEGKIRELEKAQDAYRKAIANTATGQTAATRAIVASTRREFEAKKSLLELELKRQRAAIAVKRETLNGLTTPIRDNALEAARLRSFGNAISSGGRNAGVQNYARLPESLTGLNAAARVFEGVSDATRDEIKKTRAELTLAEIAANDLATALNTTFGAGAVDEPPGGVTETDRPAKPSKGKPKSSTRAKAGRTDFADEVAAIRERTAALREETAVQAGLNPLVDDHGFALEKARAARELLNAAAAQGITLGPQERAQVDALANAYATATVEAKKLATSQEETRAAVAQINEVGRDLLGGFIQDMQTAEGRANALANVLGKLAGKLSEIGLDLLFGGGTGGGGGALGGALFSGLKTLFLADGGMVRGPGSSRSDSIPARLSNGEFVVNAAATKQHRALLEAINGGRKPIGFADGGYVAAMPVPRIPRTPAAPTIATPAAAQATRGPEKLMVEFEQVMRPDGSLQAFVRNVSSDEAGRQIEVLERNRAENDRRR